MQAVFRLIESHRARRIDNFIGNLLAAMRRQAMHKQRRRGSGSQEFIGDAIRRKHLGSEVDGVLLVVRGSYAGSRTIRRAMELLYERQAKIMGLVFNRANSASRSYEYYKYADYYHSAGKDH